MTYSVGDVFIGCPASFTGRPYDQPTVLHYASDGTTLLHTLTVPQGPAVNEEYEIQGVAVGADGRCYVISQTAGSASPPVAAGTWLDAFDEDGNWVETVTMLADTFHLLFAIPGGDLAVTRYTSGAASIDRYHANGTLVGSWTAPAMGQIRGFALNPGTTNQALLLINPDQAYIISLVDGSTILGPVTVPYDTMQEDVWGLYASTTAPYLAIKDMAAADAVWRIQQISADLSTTAGARAELAAEDFPGGGVSHLGLINNPWDVAVNGAGDTGWCVTYTTDASHTGTALDSQFRTDVRSTAIPGGSSSAVQSDVNGDSNLIYVYQPLATVARGRAQAFFLS